MTDLPFQSQSPSLAGYPLSFELGSTRVTLRPFGDADQRAMLRFAQSLPKHDLLFLRRDITDPDAVEDWIDDIGSGVMTTIMAMDAQGVVLGYGSLHRNPLRWSRHVGELRVVVARDRRGMGLGRVLTQEIFKLALAEGLEKLVAQMTLDQKGAIATFEGLGFRPEAVLRDQVKDLEGCAHDLLVMSHAVAAFDRSLDAYGVSTSLGVEDGAAR
jgi:L-amino acid N-acyltransferase YncA